MPKRFHLGWFVNFTPGAWDSTFSHGGSPWDGKFYVEFALALERACFDYIMLEDTLMVSEAYRGTAEATLKYALQVPKHDPVPLAAFMLARVCATIDHIAGGRFGWNIVTSGEDAAAQNFGLAKLPPREQRYAIADEYMEVVYRLFDAWEPDAVVKDRQRGIYADWRKVHPIDFDGAYFKVRGPLNTVPSPQGRPTFVQAGGSPRGRAFAARHADSVIAPTSTLAGIKAYRDDVRAHAVTFGRNPDDIKILFLVYPILAETSEEAHAKHRRMVNQPWFIEAALASTGTTSDIDFSQYSLDEPLPERLTTNGEQGSLDRFQQWGSGKTLRRLASERFDNELELIGTPDEVADKMEAAMNYVGGDGFLISTPFQRTSRRFINEICEGLVPALQRRGLVREEYARPTLRETLREF
jgi:long-chain alkane monooxygenase